MIKSFIKNLKYALTTVFWILSIIFIGVVLISVISY